MVEDGWGISGCTPRLMSCWVWDCAYETPEKPKSCVSVMGVLEVVEVGTGCGGVMGET